MPGHLTGHLTATLRPTTSDPTRSAGSPILALIRNGSGATLDRPDQKKALTAARAGKFDILFVYRVDRLSRSLRGLVDILDQLDDAAVGFRSATEPVPDRTSVDPAAQATSNAPRDIRW